MLRSSPAQRTWWTGGSVRDCRREVRHGKVVVSWETAPLRSRLGLALRRRRAVHRLSRLGNNGHRSLVRAGWHGDGAYQAGGGAGVLCDLHFTGLLMAVGQRSHRILIQAVAKAAVQAGDANSIANGR